MDPVVEVVGTALVNSSISILLAKLNTMIEDNKKLRKELKNNLKNIMFEMEMIKEELKKKSNKWNSVSIREVQELAYDIEDKIDEFTDRVTCSPKAGRWWQCQFTKGSCTEFAKEIESLKMRSQNAYERRVKYGTGGSADAPSAADPCAGGPSESDPYIPADELVGIEEPKQELLELLEAGAAEGEGEPASAARLQVISILGCRGIGKTTLAKLVFNSQPQPRPRAWAVASECKDARGLLRKILSQLLPKMQIDPASSLAQLGENLRIHLESQERYFIVIDDIQTHVWSEIKSSFPINTAGRIIVTTTIMSIANDWISNGGYVYRMQALNKDQAKELLMKEIFGSRLENREQFEGSQIILKKCDGLPLALVSIARYLKDPEKRTTNYCSKLCRDLTSQLQKDDSRLNKVLIHSFDNLPGHNLKTCLLSVSIFPEDHQISRKRLIRRWLAEGFLVKESRPNMEEVATDYFDNLIDRSMIQPIHTANNAAVKTCEVRGVMLDFIAHKSVSENFITFIHSNEPSPNTEITCAVRRVSLHNSSAETGARVNTDLSRVRSLTIFGHVGDCIDLGQCKLLRVLDLERCTELNKSDIQNIWRLMLLKYLSLRGTNVREIPREISNLHHLETLDMRETKVMILPIDVFSLPRLAHLFGQFKLPCELSKVPLGNKMQKILSETCRLQTLAGFFIDGSHGFVAILLHVNTLRKVKVVWSDGTPRTVSTDILISSLQRRFHGRNGLQALSIDFGGHSIDFLDSLKPPCLLTSVKLHGKLTKLPEFIKSLEGIELLLSSTSLNTDCLLALENLGKLHYLKLNCQEFVNSSFSFRSGGFPCLQRLCIQAPKLPKLNIEDGAMRHLISLWLVCKDISGFAVDDIGHLKGLKEITLVGSELSEDTRKAWEKAAKKQPLLQIHGSPRL